MKDTERFVKELANIRFDCVFNPYSDCCPINDLKDAPIRRAAGLLDLLNAASNTHVDSLWIGRDLGYRGGRRTGLALTDDVHLPQHANRWGVSIERATKGQMVAERTASVIWKILGSIANTTFLWNVFPFHPHWPLQSLSNRPHTVNERRTGEDILAELITLVRPAKLVAIGNDAGKSAFRLGGNMEVVQVRHPSYGGLRDFTNQMSSLYGIYRG